MIYNVEILFLNEVEFKAKIFLLDKELKIKPEIDKDNFAKFIEETYILGKVEIQDDEIKSTPFENLEDLFEELKKTFKNLKYSKVKK